MRKYFIYFVFLLMLFPLLFTNSAMAQDETEVAPVIEAATPEATTEPTMETTSVLTVEASSVSPEAFTIAPLATPLQEGSSYKGVLWGSDFETFKRAKGFAGNLAPYSAAFTETSDDNDIALLLGVPASVKDSSGHQRVMFEYVARKFSSVYYEPDDTYYIFYNGRFAMIFSKINYDNFDFYRDTFYKKYNKIDSFTAKYEQAGKRSYLLQSAIFEKGKTVAFLFKTQITDKKMTYASAKIVLANVDALGVIRKEIEDKVITSKMSGSEKKKQELEKDLNKIE